MTASPFKRKKFNDHLPAVDGGNPNYYLSLRGPNPNDHRSFRAAKSERPPLPPGGGNRMTTSSSRSAEIRMTISRGLARLLALVPHPPTEVMTHAPGQRGR
jgi:hypothetical protein